MDLKEAGKLARELIKTHCPGAKFIFNGGKRRFGVYYLRRNTIGLSRYLTELNNEQQVRDTILHEIAHALTPYHKHDDVWVAKALEIGCDGKRCFTNEVQRPKGQITLECPKCKVEIPIYRITKNTGSQCCGRCYRNTKEMVRLTRK